MQLLKLTSCQAPNADFICEAIAHYLGSRLDIPTQFVNDIPWQEREQLLDVGEIQVGWICGLPYVWKADQLEPQLELLAAPVMQPPRYQNRPIYFSDVVVHRDSPFQTFADLRGASWAYNEPHSQSGYNITRYHLATLGETSGYFGRVIEAGAHQEALQMVLNRQVDASAIDSTVLELELEHQPDLGQYLRIIEILGPSPIPPWVISKRVSPSLHQALRQVLLDMAQDPASQTILAAGQMARFAPVKDHDYDPIREMARLAAGVNLQVS
jgi:phosphonate transport system substrate-binding protein